MKKVIWKYQLTIRRDNFLELPEGAIILSVQLQYNSLCLWVMVNPDELKKEQRLVQVFKTNEYMPLNEIAQRLHINTVQMQDKKTVFHVFETILN